MLFIISFVIEVAEIKYRSKYQTVANVWNTRLWNTRHLYRKWFLRKCSSIFGESHAHFSESTSISVTFPALKTGPRVGRARPDTTRMTHRPFIQSAGLDNESTKIRPKTVSLGDWPGNIGAQNNRSIKRTRIHGIRTISAYPGDGGGTPGVILSSLDENSTANARAREKEKSVASQYISPNITPRARPSIG